MPATGSAGVERIRVAGSVVFTTNKRSSSRPDELLLRSRSNDFHALDAAQPRGRMDDGAFGFAVTCGLSTLEVAREVQDDFLGNEAA